MSTAKNSIENCLGLYSPKNRVTSFLQSAASDPFSSQKSVSNLKVLLVQPPVQDFYDTDVRLQPIGLCYLKAAVKMHLPDIDVIVKDFHGGSGRRTVAIPKELRYLADYYAVDDKSPFSTFHRYYHFGKSFDAIESEIAELKPNVVGISSLFTPYFREVLEIAARVKKRLNAIVVIGGSHASAVPESLLSSPHVDYVIRGEGERAFVEFLRHTRSTHTSGETRQKPFSFAANDVDRHAARIAAIRAAEAGSRRSRRWRSTDSSRARRFRALHGNRE